MKLEYNGSIKTNFSNITNNITFSVDNDHILAIVGESGSGKTMTALSILGLLPNNVIFDGSIKLDDSHFNPLHQCGKEIFYIPQNGYEALNPRLTVKSQIKDQFKINKIPYSNEKALALLQKVGFAYPQDILASYSFTLSGGMAQRVILALACIRTPKIIIADEATNGLNERDSLNFLQFLNTNFKESIKIIITHDLKMALECSYILAIKEGEVAYFGPKDEALTSSNSYIKALKDVMPGGLDVKR